MATQKHITYLFGAGASAKKIPCLNDFKNQLEAAVTEFRLDFQNLESYIEKDQMNEVRKYMPQLIQIL